MAQQNLVMHLLLIGGGHAHVQVLARIMRQRPIPGLAITMISPQAQQMYSGMLPGWLAGQYALPQCLLPVARIAERAGAQFVRASVLTLDLASREAVCDNGQRIPYDLLSLDVGSVTAGAPLPGVDSRIWPVRPLASFVEHINGWLHSLHGAAAAAQQVVIIGDGAGAVETAFALDCRFRRLGVRAGVGEGVQLALAGSRATPLPAMPVRLQRHVAHLLRARGIHWHGGARIVALTAQGLLRRDHSILPADRILQLTGAQPPAWLGQTGVAVDAVGAVRVDHTLRSLSHPEVFAAGDCAAYPDPRPKSGVFAVRAGQPLAHNLLAAAQGHALQVWQPQRYALCLLNSADGQALAAWGPFAWWGQWVWRWKDRIDRDFIARHAIDE